MVKNKTTKSNLLYTLKLFFLFPFHSIAAWCLKQIDRAQKRWVPIEELKSGRIESMLFPMLGATLMFLGILSMLFIGFGMRDAAYVVVMIMGFFFIGGPMLGLLLFILMMIIIMFTGGPRSDDESNLSGS